MELKIGTCSCTALNRPNKGDYLYTNNSLSEFCFAESMRNGQKISALAGIALEYYNRRTGVDTLELISIVVSGELVRWQGKVGKRRTEAWIISVIDSQGESSGSEVVKYLIYLDIRLSNILFCIFEPQ